MSLSRYVTATIPDRTAIFGVKLKPFCLGHYLILSRYRSPFVNPDLLTVTSGTTLADPKFWTHFVFALSVCSLSYEDFLEMVNDAELFQSEQARVGEQMRRNIAEERKNGTFNPYEKLALFREYLQDGFKVPLWSFTKPAKEGEGSSKHWSQQIKEDLVTKGNRTESGVLNMHLAEAWVAWAHLAEDAGAITLLTDEQVASVEMGNTVTVEKEGWEKLLAAYEAEHGKVIQ